MSSAWSTPPCSLVSATASPDRPSAPAKTGPVTGDFQMALVNARSSGFSACGSADGARRADLDRDEAHQELNRNSSTSPSCTTYSFPSARDRPCSRAGFQPPTRTKSS